MAVRPVLKMGEPLLRAVAQPVLRFDAALAALVADMDDTMRALSGAGIAAPQIGVSARVVIFELQENPRYPHIRPVPYTVLVNPVLTPLTAQEEEGWEGCLSVPGHAGPGAARHAPALPAASTSPASRSSARSRVSTRAWCSTRWTTSMASSSRNGCGICETSASRMCSPGS